MKNIAVLGADSLIGRELLGILQQRNYPANEIYLMAAGNRPPQTAAFGNREIELLRDYGYFLNKVDIVFCCLDRLRARRAASDFKKKSLFIDCSRALSFAPDVLHVIPEINASAINEKTRLIANPNPMTIELLVALCPLHKNCRVKRLHVVAFASVSEFGQDALDELSYEYEYLALGGPAEKAESSVFPYTIANNIIPQVGDFIGHGDTEEEAMLTREVSMILKTDDIQISTTAVWVPVQRGNCLVVYADFERGLKMTEVKEILKKAPGVAVMKNDEEYPMPENIVGKDEVFVGRLRKDCVFENGFSMWIAADNLRKGSALNAVQIAELL
jgi:aspartate-semialdehyde dehydrogenase